MVARMVKRGDAVDDTLPVSILYRILAKGMTTDQLCEDMKLNKELVESAVKRLHDLGLVIEQPDTTIKCTPFVRKASFLFKIVP